MKRVRVKDSRIWFLFQVKMVKLYALTVLYKGPVSATALKCAYDVESFSFFQKSSVREFMAFVSKTITERTQVAARQSVKEGGKFIEFPAPKCSTEIFNHLNLFLAFLIFRVFPNSWWKNA